MPIYRAKMKHSADTIKKLVQTQYDTFQFGRKILNMAIAFGLILFGLYADPSMFMPLIALFVGCVLLANINAVPRMRAKEVLQQMGGKFPKSDYSFLEKGFKFYDKGEIIPYSSLIRLVEDRQYLYLYVSEQSAYMMDKGTVTGGSLEDLKTFLKIETGLTWTRPASLFNFKLKDVLRKKEEYKGPRLK